jgi:hypothetical protein
VAATLDDVLAGRCAFRELDLEARLAALFALVE